MFTSSYGLFNKQEYEQRPPHQQNIIKTMLLVKKEIDQQMKFWKIPRPIFHGIIRRALPDIRMGFGETHGFHFEDDTLVLSGSNNFGQLGSDQIDELTNSTKFFMSKDQISKVSCGAYFTLILTKEGIVYGFGNNLLGQLGCSSQRRWVTPILFKTNEPIVDIKCGSSHSVLLGASGKVYACGYNTSGQLGMSNTENYFELTPLHSIEKPVTNIQCGGYHTIIFTNSGVSVCGDNVYGQLGLGDKIDRSVPTLLPHKNIIRASAGSNHTVYFTKDEVFVCGLNDSGQLGLGDNLNRCRLQKLAIPGETIVDAHCGSSHTLILTASGKVFGCGSNTYGQLGLPNNKKYISPTELTMTGLKFDEKIVEIGAQFNQSFFITNRNIILICGKNKNGQIDFGTKMGDDHMACLSHKI